MDLGENKELILKGIKAGAYNLYLGAGATHSCINGHNKNFPLGSELSQDLATIKGLNPNNRTLQQITSLFQDDVHRLSDIFVDTFSVTTVSKAIKLLPHYLWKSIYTLNIDNAIETAYREEQNRLQQLITTNYCDSFSVNSILQNVQVVHLHGFVEKPDDGYVFSVNEYIHQIKDNNTWMVVFSDIFSTQSFIMSGVSLTEQDADYYLSFRTSVTQKSGSYPSILIEPNPDAYTEDVCKKRDLQLIHGTFDEFMDFLSQELHCVPTAYDLTKPKIDFFAGKGISEKEQFLFFSEFEPIVHIKEQKTNEMSLFDWGFEPDLSDIQLNKDIRRDINDTILKAMLKTSQGRLGHIVVLSGKYLNGKTTIALRIMDTLAEQGNKVFRIKSLKNFTLSNTIKCLSSLQEKVFLYIDNLAEYIEPVSKLLLECKNLVILGTEREYRMDHVQKVLVSHIDHYNCDDFSNLEKERLLSKYNALGHILNENVLTGKINFSNHTVGESVCLILDSYDPISKKIPEIMNSYEEADRKALIAVAICCYCYKIGVNYFLIRGILPPTYDFNKLFKKDIPFRLEFNHEDDNYVLPRNRLYFQSLLEFYLKENIKELQKIYIEIVKKIAPFVNRKTIISKTPETKLMGRMLDADKNVKHFFESDCESFFSAIQSICAWNSRYWEQRALNLVRTNISLSLDYARHAVSIEFHPYTLTTLEYILFIKMSKSNWHEETSLCIEALQVCLKAMKEEERKNMTTIHPLRNLVTGLSYYMKRHTNETLPSDLIRNVYAAVEYYHQTISLSVSEEKEVQTIMDYLY